MDKLSFLLLLAIFVVLMGNQPVVGQIPRKSLTDINGVKITSETLKSDSVIFLISSLTCGYCLRDIP